PKETWGMIDGILLPAARPVIAGMVREVRIDPLLHPAVLPFRRTRDHHSAERAAGAIRDLLKAIGVLCCVGRGALVDIEPEPTTAFRADLARFQARWLGYLTRTWGRTEWLARQKAPQGRPRNVLRALVIARLILIVETFRRNRRGALLKRVTKYDLPGGPLYE